LTKIGFDCVLSTYTAGERTTSALTGEKGEENKVKVALWDTAGQERFRTLTRNFYRNSNGVILVFDVTDRHTFTGLKNWLAQIQDYAQPNISKVLVANKSDLVDSSQGVSEREVSRAEALQLATSYDMSYFEVSAKSSAGVKAMFQAAMKSVFEEVI
jgi:small GTP-binding protein